MKFYVNAMVIYGSYIEAESFEEAAYKFTENCPYTIEPDTIYAYNEETGEERQNFF